MIKYQREVYSWEFVFLGAKQDAISDRGKDGNTDSQRGNM